MFWFDGIIETEKFFNTCKGNDTYRKYACWAKYSDKELPVSLLPVDKVLMMEKDNPQEFGRQIQYEFFAIYNQNLYSIS